LSKAETYGRLYSCGFEIVEEEYKNNKIYFTFKKVKEPLFPKKPSYGFLIKLKRVGKDGKPIKVYKLRTMRPYSEYLQEYVFQKNNLQDGGKIKNDFRISPYGKVFRKLWLDELPMFYNFFKREMKLVGVRPLSAHYFSLYSTELQTLRIKTKPGLIPPFYADMPVTLEEIMASEMKYLKAYEKRPLYTDFSYFFKAIRNILIKRKRSQ
jgi:lipopolysaccharide/colanic/teichoic acid biosynthesis glycosyltransferase